MMGSDRALWVVAAVEAALIATLVVVLLRPPAAPYRHAEPAPAPTSLPADAAPADVASEPEAGPDPDPDPAAAARDAEAPVERATAVAAPATTLLLGRVADPDGRAIDDARLALRRGDETSTDRVGSTSTLRDAGGAFALPGLTPGRYRLDVSASGHRARGVDIEVPAGVDRLRHDVVLERTWELLVRIDTPDGRPLIPQLGELRGEHRALSDIELAAVATVDPPAGHFPPTDLRELREGVGRWASGSQRFGGGRPPLPKRYAGLLELPEDRPLHVSAVLRNAVLATAPVEAGQAEVVLTVPLEQVLASLCTVRLQVVDGETGDPVPDARVALDDRQSWSQGEQVEADGRFVATMLRPGILELGIRVADRAAPPMQITLPPGAVIDLGPVPVHRPVPVQVVFEGAGADGEFGVWVRSLDPSPHASLAPRDLRFGRPQGGALTMQLAPGRYRLRVRDEGVFTDVEFDTAAHVGAPLRVALQQAAALRVVPPGDGSLVELEVQDLQGRSLSRFRVTWTSPWEVVLPPGSFVVLVTRAGGEIERRAVTVGAEGGQLDLR
jgi:hypothetical protein